MLADNIIKWITVIIFFYKKKKTKTLVFMVIKLVQDDKFIKVAKLVNSFLLEKQRKEDEKN